MMPPRELTSELEAILTSLPGSRGSWPRDQFQALSAKFPKADDQTLLRFLAARKYDVDKAAAMLQHHLEWRASYQPEAITQERLSRSIPSGCWRMLGTMRRDDAISLRHTGSVGVLWIQLSLWRPDEYDLAEYTAMVTFFLERSARVCQWFTVLFDMEGWRFSHGLHLRKVKSLISTLQDHNPERLRAALMLRTPGVFEASWALIKPWIDPVTAAKVHFLPKGDKETAALLEHVDAALLPTTYGGSLDAATTAVPGLPDTTDVAAAKAP